MEHGGRFFFLYPLIGMKWVNGNAYFCYTTQPESFEGFDFYGAFRSREITREAFFNWMELIPFVGHPVPRRNLFCDIPAPIPKFSHVYGFRQIPESWHSLWSLFLKGESRLALEELILTLVENAGARNKGPFIQEKLNGLSRFWKHEALPLWRARTLIRYTQYPVSQKERDLLFLRYRSLLREKSARS